MPSVVDKILRARARAVPKTGFNVVAVDTYEEPGEELTVLAHFDTREEAEAFAARTRQEDAKRPGDSDEIYVYSSDMSTG